MGAYTIRELESLSGIKAHTIRIWEKRYGLITPKRTSTNIRTYCDGDLKKLLNISVLNKNGVKISAIAKLSEEEIVERINEITSDTSAAENQIECLVAAAVDLDEYRFEQVLAKSIIQSGFLDTVIRIVYPFLQKVGLMWQTGTVNLVNEHFISNLIKQKFFAAIDALVSIKSMHSKSFVFFLPEGELHELVLLFLCYLAKKRGHQVIYLGQSVPERDLKGVVRMKQVDYLVTSMTSALHSEDVEKYVSRIAHEFSDKIVYIGGSRIDPEVKSFPSNVVILSSPVIFKEKLDEVEMILKKDS